MKKTRVISLASLGVLVLAALGLRGEPMALADPGDSLSLTDVIGFGRDVDGTNPMLFRMDKDGNMLWEKPVPLDKLWAGILRYSDDRNLAEDAFYTATFAEENKIDGKHTIMKFDANGNLVWKVPLSDSGRFIVVSANPVDGGIYASVWEKGIYKIDKNGNITWGPKTYGSAYHGDISTDPTTGGVYVSTYTDKRVLKIAKDGTLVWTKEFPEHHHIDRVSANPLDGGVYVNLDEGNAHLYRLDANAAVKWDKHCLGSCWTYLPTVSPVDGSVYFDSAWPDRFVKVAMDGSVKWNLDRYFARTALAADIEENYLYTGGGPGRTALHLGISKFSGQNGALVWHKDPGYYTLVQGEYPGPRYYAYTGIPSANTPGGSDVTVPLNGGLDQVGGVEVTFEDVSESGKTTLTTSSTGSPPSTGFRIEGIAGQPMYYDINTDATSWDLVTVCISYDDSELTPEEENDLTLKRRNPVPPGPAWSELQNITRDTTNNIICGDSDTLSIFTIQLPVSVGGIVEIQVDGSGSAVDSVVDSSGGSPLPYHITLAALAGVAVVALTAGAWYARRRWLR